jgi:5-methyltetrahydrofolate--homocysteine methyltransferase
MLQANAVYGLWPANSDGDDIILWEDEKSKKKPGVFTISGSRRRKSRNQPIYAWQILLRRLNSGKTDYCGGFATTAGIGIEPWKECTGKITTIIKPLCWKHLADRLSEAFAELLHEKVRKEYWGYAKNENLSQEELQRVKYQGIRPAIGYPACPEHSEKENLFNLLKAEEVGINLTEHYAMYPNASVSGEYFAHPESGISALKK